MVYIVLYFILLVIDLTLIKLCRMFKLKSMDEDLANISFVISFVPFINILIILLVIICCIISFIRGKFIKNNFFKLRDFITETSEYKIK